MADDKKKPDGKRSIPYSAPPSHSPPSLSGDPVPHPGPPSPDILRPLEITTPTPDPRVPRTYPGMEEELIRRTGHLAPPVDEKLQAGHEKPLDTGDHEGRATVADDPKKPKMESRGRRTVSDDVYFGSVPRPGAPVAPIPTPLDITSEPANAVRENMRRSFEAEPAPHIAQSERSSEKATEPAQVEKPTPSDSDESSEKNYAVAVAIYVGLLVTGLLLLGEHRLFSTSWWYGAVYTIGGGVGAMSVTPLFRNHFPHAIRMLRAPRSLWVAATITWLLLVLNAGLAIYDHLGPNASPSQQVATIDVWPALSTTQVAALSARVQFLPTEEIVVACETIKCRDLADGIAEILRTTNGWKVSILHRGGMDITGVVGIQLTPNEPATQQLKDAIEATTGLAITLSSETRKDLGSDTRTFLTVGTRPF